MARAQNSYMAGSTSPSSLIQTACFFGASISVVLDVAVSFVTESIVAISAANVNENRNVKRKSNLDKIFISSMYKDLFYIEREFVKKSTIFWKYCLKPLFF